MKLPDQTFKELRTSVVAEILETEAISAEICKQLMEWLTAEPFLLSVRNGKLVANISIGHEIQDVEIQVKHLDVSEIEQAIEILKQQIA